MTVTLSRSGRVNNKALSRGRVRGAATTSERYAEVGERVRVPADAIPLRRWRFAFRANDACTSALRALCTTYQSTSTYNDLILTYSPSTFLYNPFHKQENLTLLLSTHLFIIITSLTTPARH